jgi:hypothetical protein
LQLQTESVIANADELRGIPIPFRVIDEEGDLVEVVLQWRREGEDFPELPGDQAALDALLADPVQRADQPESEASSGLSPYLRFGHVSPHEVLQGRRALRAHVPAARARLGLKSRLGGYPNRIGKRHS